MKAQKWINAGAFGIMAVVNALANLLPIGGYTTGQIAESYSNLFTPAPVTFSIWGVIYLLMLFFVLYQFGIFDNGVQSTKVREDIGLWFAASCVLNTIWIFLWHNRLIGWSTVCIALLLAVLVRILRCLREYSIAQTLVVKAGFSLYFGWIIAATIANVSVFLTAIHWNGWGFSTDFWTVIAILTGSGIISMIVLIDGDRIAAIAVMWAYAGILIRHLSPEYYGGTHPFIIAAGIVGEVVIFIMILAPVLMPLCRKQAESS